MNWDLLRAFASRCDAFGVPVPAPLDRGLHLVDVARDHAPTPRGSVLDLSDDEFRQRITDTSIREHDRNGLASQRGMAPGVSKVLDSLQDEVRGATLPYLEGIITDLQPRFDEAAAPLVDAAQRYGISYSTTSDWVVDQDPDTIAAFRAAKKSWFAMQPIAAFRILISTTFGLAPIGNYGTDFSVLFAAGDNWGHNGRFYLEGKTQSHLDWFALAAGGIRLNGLTDVHEKIRTRRPETVRREPTQPAPFEEVDLAVLPSYPR